MKHSILSLLLFLGLGFAPVLGFLGGGNTNYGSRNAQDQQSVGDTDQTPTKRNATNDRTQQQTAEKREAKSCTDLADSTCAGAGIDLSK